MQRESRWYVYILQCVDQSLYTGITNHLEQRLCAHNAGKGAKYTKGRGPVHLLYWEECEDKSAALRREAAIKRLKRAEKLLLCSTAEKEQSVLRK